MLKIKEKGDWKKLRKYFDKIDPRVSAFYRGVATHAARLTAIDLNSKLEPDKDPISKEYKDGLRALKIRGLDTVPSEEKGKNKKPTRIQEACFACVAVRASMKKAEEIDPNRTVIEIKPATRKMFKGPKWIAILVRHGPWTLESIPFAPKKQEAMVLYKDVSPEEVIRVRKRNNAEKKEVLKKLSKFGITKQGLKRKRKTIEGIQDLEYYSLRRELGYVLNKKPIWKPAIRKINKAGVNYLMKTNQQLWRTLFDISYTGYGRLGKFDEIDKSDVETFLEFQEKIKKER